MRPARPLRSPRRGPAPGRWPPRRPATPAAHAPGWRTPAQAPRPTAGPRCRRRLSAQERCGPDRLRLPPRELLVVTPERLLPAELDQRAQQAQRQLAVPPGLRADPVLLQRPAVGGDRVLLALRQA